MMTPFASTRRAGLVWPLTVVYSKWVALKYRGRSSPAYWNLVYLTFTGPHTRAHRRVRNQSERGGERTPREPSRRMPRLNAICAGGVDPARTVREGSDLRRMEKSL